MVACSARTAEALPKIRGAIACSHKFRKERFGDASAGGHVIERGDNVKNGPWLKMSYGPLGSLSNIVRSGPGVDDMVVPQAAVMCATVAEIDKGPHTVSKAGLGDPSARGDRAGQNPPSPMLDDFRQGPERPRFDSGPHRQLAVVAVVPKMIDIAVPAPIEITQTGFNSWFVSIKIPLEVITVGPVLVGDYSSDMRAEHELHLRERSDESGTQCLVGVVDGADLTETSPWPENVVAAVRCLLKVSGVAGKPVARKAAHDGLSSMMRPRLSIRSTSSSKDRPGFMRYLTKNGPSHYELLREAWEGVYA